MNTSLFELFKIGIGPSSSHTVGPMRAAFRFVRELASSPGRIDRTTSLRCEFFGSLALTGIGHGTDRAVLLGLSGEEPDRVDPAKIDETMHRIRLEKTLHLTHSNSIHFEEETDLTFHRDEMYPPDTEAAQSHPNGLRFTAYDFDGAIIDRKVFYSVGGGFIVSEEEFRPDPKEGSLPSRTIPYPFASAAELLISADQNHLSIADLILANECALLTAEDEDATVKRIQRPALGPVAVPVEVRIKGSILALWEVMQTCTARGMAMEGILPGGLGVRRRAPRLYKRIQALEHSGKTRDPLAPLDWVSLFAIAVNEENAAGGRVVTAPTNGAAGVIPAIAHYYLRFINPQDSAEDKDAGLLRYFLTAAAIGILYKENASISGAEVGCQGEVGVACSMAAGGLVAALKGTNAQVEHAAEIAMEHNLGMTCDPIGGLVQIPCIERNAMGAVKAVNACRMAMHETEGHKLSLDQVIETMYRTGLDMQSRYKETSQAGLALNIIEC
jgi:L-serine dehydratase